MEDLLGLKIGYVRGAFVSRFMQDNRVRFDLVSAGDAILQNFRKFLAGRIDAQYQPDLPPFLYYAAKLNCRDRIKIIPLPEKTLLYTVFSERGGRLGPKIRSRL